MTTNGTLVVLQHRLAERIERVNELRDELQRLTRALNDAMTDEQEAREILAAERASRAAHVRDMPAAASQWEQFGELVAGGVDPVKAAMIARGQGDVS